MTQVTAKASTIDDDEKGLSVNGMFVAIGHDPATAAFAKQNLTMKAMSF